MLLRAVPVKNGGAGKVDGGFLQAGVKTALPASFQAWTPLRLQQPHQLVGVGGLGEVVVEAGREGPASVLGLAVAGQGDQQDVAPEGLPETAGDLVAVEQRQADVHHRRLGPPGQALAQPLAAVVETG
jgi:hypothetical protein